MIPFFDQHAWTIRGLFLAAGTGCPPYRYEALNPPLERPAAQDAATGLCVFQSIEIPSPAFPMRVV